VFDFSGGGKPPLEWILNFDWKFRKIEHKAELSCGATLSSASSFYETGGGFASSVFCLICIGTEAFSAKI
jgi:hypothetical protein